MKEKFNKSGMIANPVGRSMRVPNAFEAKVLSQLAMIQNAMVSLERMNQFMKACNEEYLSMESETDPSHVLFMFAFRKSGISDKLTVLEVQQFLEASDDIRSALEELISK